METTSQPIDATLPVPSSVSALLLLVLANNRSARQEQVTDDAERFRNAIHYCQKLGWQLDVSPEGTVYAATAPAPPGFDDYFLALRHRVNETQNFKDVVRKMLLPRLGYVTRDLMALKQKTAVAA